MRNCSPLLSHVRFYFPAFSLPRLVNIILIMDPSKKRRGSLQQFPGSCFPHNTFIRRRFFGGCARFGRNHLFSLVFKRFCVSHYWRVTHWSISELHANSVNSILPLPLQRIDDSCHIRRRPFGGCARFGRNPLFSLVFKRFPALHYSRVTHWFSKSVDPRF